jgi:hypothetical protein
MFWIQFYENFRISKYVEGVSSKSKMKLLYSPDKISVSPGFVEPNYLTACSNKNVKITIVKIYDGEQMVIYHQSCR